MLINLSTAARHMDVIQFAPYLDWKIWTVIFLLSFACLVLSHQMKRGNVVYMVLAVLFAGIALFGSFAIADFTGPSTIGIDWVNTTYNATVVVKGVEYIGNSSASDYVYTRNIYDLSTTWLSIGMLIYFVLTVINIVYVWEEIIMKVTPPVNTKETIAPESIYKYGGR